MSSDTHNASTELSDAIERGDVAAVETLLQEHPEFVNHPEWTPPPLHCAILWNQAEVAELLIQHGADMEMPDPDRQTTALRYAIMFCKTDLIPLLLSHGAKTGPIVEGGTTALQLAIEAANGRYEEFEDLPRKEEYRKVVEVLEKAGAGE